MKKVIRLFLIMCGLMVCLCSCQQTDVDAPVQGITEESNNVNNTDKNAISVQSTAGDNNNGESLTEKLIREIDTAYLEEQKDPENSTTVGMVDLADEYTEKWKQVANEYYNKIMDYDGIIQPSENYYSSDDLHTFVSNMKTNWEQYNQVQCENYVKTLQTIYGAGTAVGPIMANYEYELQMEWALQLVDISQQLFIE